MWMKSKWKNPHGESVLEALSKNTKKYKLSLCLAISILLIKRKIQDKKNKQKEKTSPTYKKWLFLAFKSVHAEEL